MITDTTTAKEVGTASVQRNYWSSKARDWATLMEPNAMPVYEAILGKIHLSPGIRLLDVGCGAGLFCQTASQYGAQIFGLDATPALLDIAQERVPQGNFRVGDIESLPYDDHQFDVVTGLNAFQYAANPVIALKEARRVARKGAPVVVQIWGRDEDCQATVYFKALNALQPPPPPGTPGPIALSNDGALETLVKQAGLNPIEMQDVDIQWDFPDLDSTLQSTLSAGPAQKAILAAGEDRVRAAVATAFEPFKTAAGGYRLVNKFRFMIATT